MANYEMKMRFSHRWVEVEADGQECMACGDKCYLFPPMEMRIKMWPDGKPEKVKRIMVGNVVCNACFDKAGSN